MSSAHPGEADERDDSPAAVDVPPPSDQAHRLFGDRLELAQRYVARLAGDGVQHGHIGPREVPRLWERHLVNCALLTELVPPGARVVDVGSGAGLPGLPMALRRADLRLDLVEPMLRRVRFLEGVVGELGLGSSVRVVRGRAEEPTVVAQVRNADWVVTRAVAPLDRLVRWCLPLLAPGGSLLALKGASAQDELEKYRGTLKLAGAEHLEVIRLGADDAAGTWVVRVDRTTDVGRGPGRGKRRR